MNHSKNYGITHVSADEIHRWMEEVKLSKKRLRVPRFNGLHPGKAYSFQSLICSILENDESIDDFFPVTALDRLTYYEDDDVIDANRC